MEDLQLQDAESSLKCNHLRVCLGLNEFFISAAMDQVRLSQLISIEISFFLFTWNEFEDDIIMWASSLVDE